MPRDSSESAVDPDQRGLFGDGHHREGSPWLSNENLPNTISSGTCHLLPQRRSACSGSAPAAVVSGAFVALISSVSTRTGSWSTSGCSSTAIAATRRQGFPSLSACLHRESDEPTCAPLKKTTGSLPSPLPAIARCCSGPDSASCHGGPSSRDPCSPYGTSLNVLARRAPWSSSSGPKSPWSVFWLLRRR